MLEQTAEPKPVGLPPFLPPRRPSSLPNFAKSRASATPSTKDRVSTVDDPPAFLPPRRPTPTHRSRTLASKRSVDDGKTIANACEGDASRPQSYQSFSSGDTAVFIDMSLQRASSTGSTHSSKHPPKTGATWPSRTSSLEPIRDGEQLEVSLIAPTPRWPYARPPVLRQSSLRVESRLSEEDLKAPVVPPSALGLSYSDPQLGGGRPYSHPACVPDGRGYVDTHTSANHSQEISRFETDMTRQLQVLQPCRSLTASSGKAISLNRSPTPSPSPGARPRPRPSLARLSSLDNLMTYREEKAEWKRASSVLQQSVDPTPDQQGLEQSDPVKDLDHTPPMTVDLEKSGVPAMGPDLPVEPRDGSGLQKSRSGFRHLVAEIGFCFTIAMTQFMAEYLISGFAIELPKLLSNIQIGSGSMGIFWPASLLSLVLSATLLVFARLSDIHGGYPIFVAGLAWLAIWTLVPGFCSSMIMLDVSRAMQGLAIAAFTPSTFAMVGSIYSEGPRRNFVLGLYSGCAPLGFFAGFAVAGALPVSQAHWYFWIASALSFVTLVTAFLSVPSDRIDRRRKLALKMDWVGSLLITSGLILVAYSLSVEPYANHMQTHKSGFAFPIVIGPLVSGFACLAAAFWYEGWCAACPLLPFEFFRPKGVKPFALACLCFYASYGVWLYNSAEYFQSPNGITRAGGTGLSGVTLALWYLPTAIGGIILCIAGGSLIHRVPIMILLLVSALAWIAAPLLLATAPTRLPYWSYVFPSMICATLGIDLTFTISILFLSSVQPLRYQGLAGAVSSIFVNLAMSFALSISEIVMKKAETPAKTIGSPSVTARELSGPEASTDAGFRATFIYAAASAGLGLFICLAFVRISRSVVRERPIDEERPRPTSSESTLVGEGEEQMNVEDVRA